MVTNDSDKQQSPYAHVCTYTAKRSLVVPHTRQHETPRSWVLWGTQPPFGTLGRAAPSPAMGSRRVRGFNHAALSRSKLILGSLEKKVGSSESTPKSTRKPRPISTSASSVGTTAGTVDDGTRGEGHFYVFMILGPCERRE